MTTTVTRRDRQRAATIDEIKAAALAQIASGGAASLSLRGIARAIGMSPAGLYRYYDGIDQLVTELLADAYNDLADAVEGAAAGPGASADRLRAAMLAYRLWSTTHPNRFLLIFGTPIPGYAAPGEGPTVVALRRMGAAFFGVIATGLAAGDFLLPSAGRPITPAEAAFAAEMIPAFPAQHVAPVLGAWAAMHGMVTLEVVHQLDWIYPDAAGFYAAEVDRLVTAFTAAH